MRLTLIVNKGDSGFFIGKIKEMPAVMTQGHTIDEVKENIVDALALYLEDMREDNSNDNGNVVLEEDLIIA